MSGGSMSSLGTPNTITPVRGMSVSASFEDASALPTFNGDELTKKLHFSVWPQNDFGTFKVIT